MRFPEYNMGPELYEAPNESLVRALLRVVAPQEASYYQHRQLGALAYSNIVDTASHGITIGCAQIRAGESELGRQTIQDEVETNIKPYTRAEQTNPVQRELLIKNRMADVILEGTRDGGGEVLRSSARQRLHNIIVEHLFCNRQLEARARKIKAFAVRDRLRGRNSELEGASLTTRLCHPWLLAMPSFEHEGKQPIRGHNQNYDLLLIEGLPGHEPRALKVEIKSQCFGQCEEKRKQRRPPGLLDFEELREHYAPDIALISACCNMQVPKVENSELNVATLLKREQSDAATPGQIAMLDTMTNSLLLSITAGPGAGIPQVISAD